MAPYIILGVLLGLPLVLGVLLRVGAPHLFFALLAGELLERYFGSEVEILARTLTNDEAILAYAKIAILILPILLTAIFLKKGIKKSKIALHLIPFLATGLVFSAFAAPLLPLDMQVQLSTTEAGRWILDSTNIIVGSMVALQLVYLWIINGSKKEHNQKHKK